ncbi:superoxide dismutase [Propionimicrobium sp. PCR01-08-3]|uniref:superoxide dismutase n=1 Tax=Propionimicrobium sp. PCR01-08-3 TaxID=3052086 RepID=UPI00255CF20C|nr:superoxide dismutase [Propionimicrobium sp. PCR01-08-3]WIY83227.1 superoxide dismutase [Propionimicrobium sp. PCR01-08-3]
MAVYTLPDLDYDYSALEPYISAEIMQLHHDKHHKTYVDGANTALDKLAEARDKGDFGTISKLEKDLAFNLAGHQNHSVFWKNLGPNAPEAPSGDLAAAIDEYFDSFDAFKKQFGQAALSIQGSGWGALVYDPLAGRLNTLSFYDHQNNLPVGSVPLLLLDMWEHAFYLQYKNVKADYVDAFWHVVNWNDVAERFAKASVK